MGGGWKRVQICFNRRSYCFTRMIILAHIPPLFESQVCKIQTELTLLDVTDIDMNLILLDLSLSSPHLHIPDFPLSTASLGREHSKHTQHRHQDQPPYIRYYVSIVAGDLSSSMVTQVRKLLTANELLLHLARFIQHSLSSSVHHLDDTTPVKSHGDGDDSKIPLTHCVQSPLV